MLWFYAKGYTNSIRWEVTTSAEVIEYPAVEILGDLMDFSVDGEKYLLSEKYSGGPIIRNRLVDTLIISLSWLAICIVLTASSYLKRYGFLILLGLFTLMLNRFNLWEVGLFGLQDRYVILIPFLALTAPLFFFHAYRPNTRFLTRLLVLLGSSALIVIFGINEPPVFLDHFVSHSLFTFALASVLFLFMLAEENVFGILKMVTQGKGGKNNFKHLLILSLIYLVNLILYYLNKSGYVPNSFSFFDPFVLLAISCVISVWTLKHKTHFFDNYVPKEVSFIIFHGLGILLFSMLALAFFRGNDAIYESFHYFILYFHIGFGVFFFLYLIINFIDPLIQGFEVFKFAYKEQHFPYVSARLGGLVVVLGFYFLANQEPYNLLRSGYYVNLGNLEETLSNPNLADQYYRQASFLGYNTHHSNYQLAWNYSDKGNEFLTKTHFKKAASRYPSAFAYVNYSNLDIELNPSKVQAVLDQASNQFKSGEIRNNQGVLRMQLEEYDRALQLFDEAESSDTWNQAPLLNKWAANYKINAFDSSQLQTDYEKGNHGVKSNLLVNFQSADYTFDFNDFENVPILHRQAYLLASAPYFKDDTLASLALSELENSTDGNFNDRLRKALTIHYYNKGEVNKAFRMMDVLQVNTYQSQKGTYLNDLGKLAFDQQAYRLALEFFDQAIEAGVFAASINKIEVLFQLGRDADLKDALLEIVKEDPSLTNFANHILSQLEIEKETSNSPTQETIMEDWTDEELIKTATLNAFDESSVIQAVNLLSARGNIESYNAILEAIEINPYHIELLKVYAMVALQQNLSIYGDTVLPRIEELSTPAGYASFLLSYESLKNELAEDAWQ